MTTMKGTYRCSCGSDEFIRTAGIAVQTKAFKCKRCGTPGTPSDIAKTIGTKILADIKKTIRTRR